ncbi:hypothetical protein CYMTET_53960 [Cymbomonas tetramitiformis]|uniref:EF-hand domain-containing protein n=1 Tax=Cymbomonas tetramitiformis TaxID=36881 RepID=A0AAE0ER81_9CHLO|nr:hypothetical protein CYMTET_53960 [Cymbomonas tetramitiformis]|eukprot:gene28357-35141_t
MSTQQFAFPSNESEAKAIFESIFDIVDSDGDSITTMSDWNLFKARMMRNGRWNKNMLINERMSRSNVVSQGVGPMKHAERYTKEEYVASMAPFIGVLSEGEDAVSKKVPPEMLELIKETWRAALVSKVDPLQDLSVDQMKERFADVFDKMDTNGDQIVSVADVDAFVESESRHIEDEEYVITNKEFADYLRKELMGEFGAVGPCSSGEKILHRVEEAFKETPSLTKEAYVTAVTDNILGRTRPGLARPRSHTTEFVGVICLNHSNVCVRARLLETMQKLGLY